MRLGVDSLRQAVRNNYGKRSDITRVFTEICKSGLHDLITTTQGHDTDRNKTATHDDATLHGLNIVASSRLKWEVAGRAAADPTARYETGLWTPWRPASSVSVHGIIIPSSTCKDVHKGSGIIVVVQISRSDTNDVWYVLFHVSCLISRRYAHRLYMTTGKSMLWYEVMPFVQSCMHACACCSWCLRVRADHAVHTTAATDTAPVSFPPAPWAANPRVDPCP